MKIFYLWVVWWQKAQKESREEGVRVDNVTGAMPPTLLCQLPRCWT